MKKYVLMHYGFEKPTQEIMEAWGEWFESIQDNTIDNLGFRGGREVSKDGSRELPGGAEQSLHIEHQGLRSGLPMRAVTASSVQ